MANECACIRSPASAGCRGEDESHPISQLRLRNLFPCLVPQSATCQSSHYERLVNAAKQLRGREYLEQRPQVIQEFVVKIVMLPVCW